MYTIRYTLLELIVNSSWIGFVLAILFVMLTRKAVRRHVLKGHAGKPVPIWEVFKTGSRVEVISTAHVRSKRLLFAVDPNDHTEECVIDMKDLYVDKTLDLRNGAIGIYHKVPHGADKGPRAMRHSLMPLHRDGEVLVI